jgi:hypothetical protein
MSTTGKRRFRRIVEAVIEAQGANWKSITGDTARGDAEAILEAVVAELGVEPVVTALDHQGLKGEAYRYLIAPLVAEAQSRRGQRNTVDGGALSDNT